jgi:cytochrome P450
VVIMSLATVKTRTYPFGAPVGLELDGMYAYLREHEPLAAVRQPFGDPAWLVTRYDDVRLVLSDTRFSRAEILVRDAPRIFSGRVPGGLLELDPPEHTRLRRLVSGAFRARTIELLRARVEKTAAELLDRMVHEGPPADLVERFAIPLPLTMICELMGVPYGDRERFQLWADAYLSTTDLPVEEKMARLGKLGGYIAQLVAKRSEELAADGEPSEDLIGVMVQTRDDEGGLSGEKLIGFLMMLLAAGYETTSSQLTNSVYTLLTHPEQLALLRSGRASIENAVEELLRYVPITVATIIPRYATEDVELSGGTVRAGEAVLPAYDAANRDPRVFNDPERLDLTRIPHPAHVTFGYGTHFCLGAQLARIELQVALSALLRYFPDLRLAEEGLRWKTGLIMRGPVALPISW